MKKYLVKMMSYFMVTILLISLPYATVDAASASYVKTVTSQKELNGALKSSAIKTIIIKSGKTIKLAIGSKDYSDKEVFINAPKAVIVNNATFKTVEIISNSDGSWTEKGDNNSFIIESHKAKLIVGKMGIIKKITTNQEMGQLNLVIYGEVKNLTVNETSNIRISGTGNKELPVVVKAKDTMISDTIKVSNIENRSTGSISVQVDGNTFTIEKGTKVEVKKITAAEGKDNEEKDNEEKDNEEKDNEEKDTAEKDTEGIETEKQGSKDQMNPEDDTKDSGSEQIPNNNSDPSPNNGTGNTGVGNAGEDNSGAGNGGSDTGSGMIVIPVHLHNYTYIDTVEPTCTVAGVRSFTCEANDDTYTEVIPAKGHNYISTITKAATCTEDGIRTFTCSNCNDINTEIVSATGHNVGEWEITKDATVTEYGLRVQKCKTCEMILQTEQINKLPCEHSYTSSITKTATCTEEGVRTYTCASCGNSYTEVIPRIEAPAGDIHTVELTVTDGYTPTSVTGRDNLELAYQVYEEVNVLRVSLGLNALTWDTTMDDYTQLRAAEVTQKFNHERPNEERGYEMNDTITSENIGVGYATAEEVMEAWINSPAHYNAMINPNYTSIAVGCFEEQITINGEPTGDYYTGWVQFFHGDDPILLIEE